MQSDEKSNQQHHSVKKNEMITVIGALFFIFFQMSTCISLVLHAHGVIRIKVENLCPLKECIPRKINNERYWNGVSCIEAIDYDEMCTNSSTNNECKYLTQGTSCIGPTPYKCLCYPGKYFNKDNFKCESLLEINETCSQIDACKYGNCIGLPLKCQCLPLQYFDQISGQCIHQLNFSSPFLFPTSSTGSIISSSTTKVIITTISIISSSSSKLMNTTTSSSTIKAVTSISSTTILSITTSKLTSTTTSSPTTTTSDSSCYKNSANNLMDVFTNFSINISITSLNGNIFSMLQGFGMMCDFNASYYVIDYTGNKIFTLDDNYNYVSMTTFTSPTYMTNVNSSLYIAGQSNIWKTDKYLNILMVYTESGAKYRGIYYDSTENLLYLPPIVYTYFQAFDLNLNLNHTVDVSPKNPRSLAKYNNEIYVGTTSGSVQVVANKIVIRSFTACSSGSISSIGFDENGLMAISCESINLVNLYYYNGTFTGKSLTIPANPTYVGFDSKGHFVVISKTQISVYY